MSGFVVTGSPDQNRLQRITGVDSILSFLKSILLIIIMDLQIGCTGFG